MGNELVSDSLAPQGGEGKNSATHSYYKTFLEHLPYYLSIGMTPEQFWDGDPLLAKYYRKADELKRQRKNQELWLQGMYIYEALCDVAPIFNAFAKRGTKATPYSDHPYSITTKEREDEKKLQEKRDRDKARRYMEAQMVKLNKRFESKQERM